MRPVKYKVGSPTRKAFKKGNLAIGLNDDNYGPTSQTGYYAGALAPEGGYVITTLGSNNKPEYRIAHNDVDLINFAKQLGGNVSNITEAKIYLTGRTNTTLLAYSGNSNIITEGLQSYIDFSDPDCYSGTGSTFNNLANNGIGYLKSCSYSGENNGIISTTGGNDGTRNYVGSRININTVGEDLDRFNGNNNFTIGFWVKYKGNGNRIFSTGSAGSGITDGCIWQFWLDSGAFYWWNSGGGSANNISTGITTIPQNTWSYVAIAYSPNEAGINKVRVYRNGTLIGTGSRETSIHSARDRRTQTNLQYTLGGGYYSSCYTRNSANDFGSFQVYNRTLSQDEIIYNYENTKSRFGL